MKSHRIVVVAVAAVALAGGGLAAQQARDSVPPPPLEAHESPMLEQAAGVARSLGELVAILREHLEVQQSQLLMKRIEIKTGSLAVMENELRRLREGRQGVESEIHQLESRLELHGESVSGRPPGEQDERLTQEFAFRIKMLNEQLRAMDLQVMEAENDLVGRRRDLRDLEEILDARMGLR